MKVLLSYVLQFSKQYALMSCIPITVHESRNVIYAIIHTCVCYYVRNSVEVVRSQLFTAVVRICKEFFKLDKKPASHLNDFAFITIGVH